jgi:hypothetical protein
VGDLEAEGGFVDPFDLVYGVNRDCHVIEVFENAFTHYFAP